MVVKIIFMCFALISLLFNYANSLTLTRNPAQTLDTENPEEFVDNTEKAVKEVEHLRVISDKMNSWLSQNSLDASRFCSNGLGACTSLVDKFLERCKKGDCFTLDNVKVFSSSSKNPLNLPHLAQYEVARHVFRKSGAGKNWFVRKLSFKSQNNKYSRSEYENEVLKRNLDAMTFEDDTSPVLNELFYSFTQYYQNYLNSNSTLSKLHNLVHLSRKMFELRRRKPLQKLAQKVVGNKVLNLSHSDLKSMTDSFVLYLTVGNPNSRYRVANSFGKLSKHAVSNTMGYRKVSFLMADRLLEFPLDPDEYCTANAEVGCKQKLLKYFQRCDLGDCTTLDTNDLLDPKDWLNVKLPELSEVWASFDLFSGSMAKAGPWFKRVFLRRGGMTSSEFQDLLYQRNASNVTYHTKNQGVFHRVLFKGALEFVYRARKTEVTKTLGNSSRTMMNFLSSVLGNDRVFLEPARVKSAFVAYRNYLFKSGKAVSLTRVNQFTRDLQHAFFSYLHDPHNGVYNKKYEEEWNAMKEKELKNQMKELRKLQETLDEMKGKGPKQGLFKLGKEKAPAVPEPEAEVKEGEEEAAPEKPQNNLFKKLWGVFNNSDKVKEEKELVDSLKNYDNNLEAGSEVKA